MTSDQRKEAKEWFKNRAKEIPMQGALEMYRRAIAALSEDWTPVKEALPDKDGKYRVCCKTSFNYTPNRQGELDYSCEHRAFGEWSYYTYLDGSYDSTFIPTRNDVVAWRELPEDYKGD